MNRESIYSALFGLLEAGFDWKRTSRTLEHWNEVKPFDQPYMAMVQMGESYNSVTGQPNKVVLRVDVYIYSYSSDPTVPAVANINKALDALAPSIKGPAAIGVQTLGGQVEFVKIDGSIETDEGSLGPQAVAIVPLSILVTD